MLRGINVSGHKRILMTDLKLLFENLGFEQVTTYIQSGNVIFSSSKELTELQFEQLITSAIAEKYGFHVPVIIRSVDDLRKVAKSNPHITQNSIDLERLYVTFLSEIPSKASADKIVATDFLPEKFQIIGREVYLYCPLGYGESKLSNTFFEKKLKVQATTRNWNTVNKLLELSGTI